RRRPRRRPADRPDLEPGGERLRVADRGIGRPGLHREGRALGGRDRSSARVTGRTRFVILYCAASLICAGISVALVFASHHETQATTQTIFGEIIELSFT